VTVQGIFQAVISQLQGIIRDRMDEFVEKDDKMTRDPVRVKSNRFPLASFSIVSQGFRPGAGRLSQVGCPLKENHFNPRRLSRG